MKLSIQQAVFAFAGFMVLLSLTLTYYIHPNFVYLTAFVGLNLMQYAFSGFCPVAILFKKLGLKDCGEAWAVGWQKERSDAFQQTQPTESLESQSC